MSLRGWRTLAGRCAGAARQGQGSQAERVRANRYATAILTRVPDFRAGAGADTCQRCRAARNSRCAFRSLTIYRRRGLIRRGGLFTVRRGLGSSCPTLLFFLLARFPGLLLLLSRVMVVGFGHEISIVGEAASGA